MDVVPCVPFGTPSKIDLPCLMVWNGMKWNETNFLITPFMSKVAGWWAGLPLAMVMLLFVIAIFLYIVVNGFSVFHEPLVHSPSKALH